MLLSNTALSRLDERVSVPQYDRNNLVPRFVHIGLGHFHRAHYLSYLEKLLNGKYCNTGVFEVDIIPANTNFIENLKKQDFLYSLQTKATDGTETITVNGGITGYANAAFEPEKVLAILTAATTKVISLTVTEKGYCYDDNTDSLNKNLPQVRKDIESDSVPVTVIGFLAKALKVRYENGRNPVTILSCDNIPVNGSVLKTCLLEFIEEKYPEIKNWVENTIHFPCTMVDRITPGTTAYNIEEIKTKYGFIDECAVHCEDFIQWVIEDTGSEDIRLFSKAGASLVKSVKPYELMKIRLLNGSHSALSYPAYLMGIRNVDEAVANPLIASFIRNSYMEQISLSLPPVPGIDLDSYKDKLISRFANKNIADTILRLAGDGSKKIANAIIKPLHELKDNSSLVLALAFWARFLEGTDEQGKMIPVEDPLKIELMDAQKDDSAFLLRNGITDTGILQQFTEYRHLISQNGTEWMLKAFLRQH